MTHLCEKGTELAVFRVPSTTFLPEEVSRVSGGDPGGARNPKVKGARECSTLRTRVEPPPSCGTTDVHFARYVTKMQLRCKLWYLMC